MAIKNCSKCKEAFDCCNEQRGLPAGEWEYNRKKAGCWCENYELSLNTLQKLRQEYDNCLCERCLKSFAVGQLQPEK